MSLTTLIEVGSHYQEIASFLDHLSHPERIREVDQLKRRHQKKLFELVEDADPVTLEHFVPKEIGPMQEVIHYGKNTLPLIPKLRRFQKRFCLEREGDDTVFGYNEGVARRVIGPGYFVAETTEGRADWESKGAIVINYLKIPRGSVPSQWPKVVPNSKGLQMFVYNQTLDFMRKVSEHVSIGAAYRGDTPLHNWFVLCREDL